MKMKRTSYIPVLAAAALFASACHSELQKIEEFQEGDGTVCFLPTISGSDLTVKTRSFELVSSDGSTSIPLHYAIREGIEDRQEAKTRGIQKNTGDSFDDLGNYFDSLYVKAWKGNVAFISSYELATKGTDVWETAEKHLWNANDSATFYAYANVPGSIAEVKNTSSTVQTLEYDVPTSAAGQQDILLGYYQGRSRYNPTLHRGGIADLTFYHPLTAVKFKKGDFDGVASDKVKFKSISITDVYDSGKATMTPTTMKETDPGMVFNWNTSGSSKQTVTLTPASGATYLTVASDGLIGEAFLLIPQTMTSTEKVKITVEVELDGTTSTLEAELDDNIWEAGKTNIYTLGYDNKSYSYSFTYSDNEVEKYKSVVDTTEDDTTFSYDLISTKSEVGNPSNTVNPGWKILSYKTKNGYSVPVDNTTFTDEATGLTVTADISTNRITVQASARELVGSGTHDYWINKDNRTDNLDWSPISWGSEGLNKGIIDLSKFNYQKETALGGMTTSNCYIVRHAGTYMLPLVYGNAVVDGAPNTDAYAPSSTGLTPFQNHLGNGITSPFIENNTGCTAVAGAVVWQDKAEVIKNVEIVDGTSNHSSGDYTVNDVRYLKFTIAQEDIRQCNAIIAIKDGTGNDANIIWSWHIWITNNPEILSHPIPVTNISSKEYDFFPLYCLGWTDRENYRERDDLTIVLMQKESGQKVELTVNQPELPRISHGTFYQWGRKDPMCSSDSPAVGSFYKTAGKVSIATAICNPNTLYYTTNTSGDDWCDITYYNLWTGKRNTKESPEQSNEMIKTIYDPSPIGYKVPAIKAFSGFSSDGNAVTIDAHPTDYFDYFNVTSTEDNYSTLQGWYFYTRPNLPDKDNSVPAVFFPALGYRYFTNGEFVLEGKNTGYWSANTNVDNNGLGFHFRSGYLLPVNGFSRTFGCSVRPVIDPTMTGNPMK